MPTGATLTQALIAWVGVVITLLGGPFALLWVSEAYQRAADRRLARRRPAAVMKEADTDEPR